MGSQFAEDRLDTPEFTQRLGELLAEARERLAVSWIGVAELAIPGGEIRATWRASTGGKPAALEPNWFERLVQGPREFPAGAVELLPFGEPLASDRVQLLDLAVTPRLASATDALLVMAHSGAAPAADAVIELVRCLERGLSADRKARLAAVLAAAMEQAADAIELTDRDGRLYFVNRAWETFTGYSAAEALGRTVGQVLRDTKAPLHDSAFYQFTMAELHAGRPWMGALAQRTRDGQRVFCEVNVAPFVVTSPELHGHAAIRRDLAHRSERDEALALAHYEFRSVLSAIPDGVCVLRDERVYFVNAAFMSIVRLSEAGVIGREFAEFVHPDDRAQFEQQHASKVRRVRMTTAGSAPRFVEISTAGEVSFEGKAAVILLARDTTDYQLAREELSRAEKLSALGSLAAGVAHELNNPLAYVALNLELIGEHEAALAQPEREALREVIDGVSRMRLIVAELHTFSGSDGPGPPEPVDVSRALTSALNIAQNEIRHRAALVRDLEDGLFILGREGQLVQVLVNVLVNAAQSIVSPSVDENAIRVRSRARAGGRVEIVVTDTGAGIPAHVLPTLFDPFSTSKRRGEGSGLGLAICKRIVQSFGGEIRITSTVGRGTGVTIELPETSRAPALRPRRPKGGTAEGPPIRVLIIDDERSIARALKRILTAHDVTLAEDGQVALALVASEPDFDVVLCDLMMPGLSGAQVYTEACRLKPDLGARFVFMTGGAVTPPSKEFLKNTDGRVLYKPFEPAAALECVEQVVRKAGRARGKGDRSVTGDRSRRRNAELQPERQKR